MRKLNCKSGDLAIIIQAYNAVNIGAIVKIIGTHKNQVAISKEAEDHLWTVIALRPLTYAINGKLVLKCRGPAPDSTMRPIRGVISRADIKVENSKEEIFYGRSTAKSEAYFGAGLRSLSQYSEITIRGHLAR